MLHARAYISQKRDAKSAVKVDERANFAENASVIHEFAPKKFMDDAGRVLAEGCKKASAGVGEV